MNQYLAVINAKTFIAVFISILTTFFAYHFNIYYNIDLTLISIAIVFPLVFSIRSSFRRREKALEHLSQFRSAIKILDYHFSIIPSLPQEKKTEMSKILIQISDAIIEHLSSKNTNTQKLDKKIDQVHAFMIDNSEFIPKGANDKILKYMNDLHEAVDNSHAIYSHRTPISLKAYCLVFIYIFPFVYSPSMVFKIGLEASVWATYFIVSISQFFLISLYNIQDHLEHPFDQDGLDDIKLDEFRINRS